MLSDRRHMTSKAETFAELAEAERLESHQDKRAAGLIPVPGSLVGRGGIYDTTWLTLAEARQLGSALVALQSLTLMEGMS